jgi:hypothetical protein
MHKGRSPNRPNRSVSVYSIDLKINHKAINIINIERIDIIILNNLFLFMINIISYHIFIVKYFLCL